MIFEKEATESRIPLS